MQKNKHGYRVGLKTKLLNIPRQVFRIPAVEKWLVEKTRDKGVDNTWCKLIPPVYTYPAGSFRTAERNGINYYLDISNVVDHNIYFGYKDGSDSFLFSRVRETDTIFDVGANIGSTTLPFGKMVKNGEVFSFEPSMSNYKRILANMELNPSIKNIHIFDKGLGEKKERVKLYKVDANNPGMNRILPGNEENNYDFEEIVTGTMDDFVQEYKPKKINLVKIDVEGYEMSVLKGAVAVLETYKPALFIELDDENLKGNGSSAKELVSFLVDRKYQCINVLDSKPVDSSNDFKGCHFDIFCERK